jgi:hypothetical protein
MEQTIEKILSHLKDIVKIKIHNNTSNKKNITLRMVRGNIYAYDCGETYATVYMLSSQNELIEKIQDSISDCTIEVIVKYTDNSKDVFKMR